MNSTRKRVLLARLFHETNTFAPGTMGLKDFQVTFGAEILKSRGDASTISAFLDEAEKENWEVLPVIDIRGTPGAQPEREVMDLFFGEFFKFTNSPAGKKLDAIFLVLHGAMVAPGMLDPEGELLARIRKEDGLSNVPIFAVLDLHGNITPLMAENSNVLLAYRKNPHTDAAESAARTAQLLAKSFASGIVPRTYYVGTNILWPPTGTATAEAPMKTLEDIARSEEHGGIQEISVYAGFAHADTPYAGLSFTIMHDPKVPISRLEAIAAKLRGAAEAEKNLGFPDEWKLEEALDDALSKGLYPTCIVEPADNIGGGTTGDGTSILRALIDRKVRGAGVVICDPETVSYLQDKAPGGMYDLRVGGKTFSGDPGPVELKAKLLRCTDGNYTLEDRHSHSASMSGIYIKMGACAVVETPEGITILLTSRRSAPMDLGQWRSQGVEPASLSIIGVKAAVAHRQAYDKISKASYWVQTPGPCTSNLHSLSYKHLRRPIFPLDNTTQN